MTQENNQSVRNEAEAANTNKSISTFEEVCAMPYVQESIRTLIDQNVRKYPVLASHEDDLRQEMLISIWKELPKFNPERASIKTYLRKVLQSSIAVARRQYFSNTNLTLAYAENIADYEFSGEDFAISEDKLKEMSRFLTIPLDAEILRMDMEIALKTLPSDQRIIAKRIMNGESLRQIGSSLGMHHYTVWFRYVAPIREAFMKFF